MNGDGDGGVRPQRGDELELTVDSLAFGGEGVARLGDGGYVVFVAGAIPGDRVRAVVHKRKRSYAHARTLEMLEASPERIPPVADHPGVPWQVLPYERQLQIKAGQVDEALRRIGHLDGFELEEIVPALEQWRYRNKLEYSFGGGRGRRGARVRLSRPGRWQRSVTPIEDCMLASEVGNRARIAALTWCREQGLSAWDRGRGRGAARGSARADPGPAPDGRVRLRNLVVREGRRTGMLQVRIVTTHGELEAGELAAALQRALGDSLCGRAVDTHRAASPRRRPAGRPSSYGARRSCPSGWGSSTCASPPEAFFQTNTEMAELLYGVVVEYAALEGWERVYDLYSGIGTIALTLAPRAGRAVGDRARRAGRRRRDRRSAGATRSRKAQFFAGDTRLALPELLERAGRPDVIVVDPPRAGLSKKVVHRIIDASPKRIVYVSCNPTTLAPNAAELVRGRLGAEEGPPGRHVSPDTPHRVRRAARARLIRPAAGGK